MQQQPTPVEKTLQAFPPFEKLGWIVREQGEIIDIPQIRGAQDLFGEVIELIEVYVCKKLTGQITQGEPPSTKQWRKEIVAREQQVDGFLRIRPVDDAVEHRERGEAGDPTPEVSFKYVVVNGWKVTPDVATQHVIEAIAIVLVSPDGTVYPPTRPIRIGVIDEARFEKRFDYLAQGMMHDAIAKGCGRYASMFGIVDVDDQVSTGLPCPGCQFALDCKCFGFKPRVKRCRPGLASLAPHGAIRSRGERLKIGKCAKEMINSARHDWP